MNYSFELKQRNLSIPEPLALTIRERADRLNHFCDRIQRCTITLEGPSAHHRRGLHSVQIDLTVPGKEIVINRHENVNLHLALKGAFEAASRQLEDHVRVTRGFVKSHENA